MDTNDLSRGAYDGIIIEVEKLTHDLTLHYGLLSSDCKNKAEYIDKARKAIDYLYKRPMITADKVSEIASISMPSSYKLISELEKLNVLTEKTGGQRSRVYAFDNYLNLFR